MRLIILEATSDLRGFDCVPYAFDIRAVDSFLQEMPGEGSIQRAGIDVSKAKSSAKFSSHAAFPRRGRTIDGNNPISVSHPSILSSVPIPVLREWGLATQLQGC